MMVTFQLQLVRHNEGVIHFKLTRSKETEVGWTVNGQKFRNLQQFIKKFQEANLVSNNNKEKVKLSSEAEIDVVVVDEDSDYYDYCDKNSVHYETVDNDDTQELENQPKPEMQK